MPVPPSTAGGPVKPAVIGLAGLTLTDDETALLREHRPVGVILFARNIESPFQLRALTSHLRALLPDEAALLVDQEGGRVARLRPPFWHAHPPAATLGELHKRDPIAGLRAAWLTGALIGSDCAGVGLNVACAPVLDLHVAGAHDVIGDRSFGGDPESVASMGGAFAAGLLAAGVQPVAKHIPGHGRALADSHLELPVVHGVTAEELTPFQRNAALPWAMTAHILYPDWDPQYAATLSPTIIARIIRATIGFSGVLVSDDLGMHALQGTPGQLASAALQAGCDIVLHCSGLLTESCAVLESCPPITQQATARLHTAQAAARRAYQALDPATLLVERDGLLA